FRSEDADPGDTWIGFRCEGADPDAQAAHLAKTDAVATWGWRLRTHRHVVPKLRLGEPPAPMGAPDPFARIADLEARLAALEQGRPYVPPIGGGAMETPAYVISASEHGAALFRQASQSFLSGTGVIGSGDLLVTPNSPAAMN